ncbi:MAG: hypothetical protein QQN63_05740, partial [Nitrosopumilus sp.]
IVLSVIRRGRLNRFYKEYKVGTDTIRLSVPISKELNDTLTKFLVRGTKAQVIRELISLLIKAQKEQKDSYIVDDLLRGRCKITVQSLKG